ELDACFNYPVARREVAPKNGRIVAINEEVGGLGVHLQGLTRGRPCSRGWLADPGPPAVQRRIVELVAAQELTGPLADRAERPIKSAIAGLGSWPLCRF